MMTFTLCYRCHLNLQGFENLGGFVVLSFRWLNLEGFNLYFIQRKPSHACKGFMTEV